MLLLSQPALQPESEAISVLNGYTSQVPLIRGTHWRSFWHLQPGCWGPELPVLAPALEPWLGLHRIGPHRGCLAALSCLGSSSLLPGQVQNFLWSLTFLASPNPSVRHPSQREAGTVDDALHVGLRVCSCESHIQQG